MDSIAIREQHWQVIERGTGITSDTPEGLWQAAVRYFDWCDTHPLMSKRTITSGKEAGKQVEIENVRPYTIDGLCMHCNIDYDYIMSIKNMKSQDSPFAMVMNKIMQVIRTQNIEYAITGEYNAIFTGKILAIDRPEETSNSIKIEVVNGTPALCDDEGLNSENSNFGKSDQENAA